MARIQQRYPSYQTCVEDILSRSPAPLSIDELMTQVGTQRPMGKSARTAIYQALDKLFQAIPVAPARYGWLSVLLNNQHFRHPLNKTEIRQGYIWLDELEHAVFFPQFFQNHENDGRRVTIHLMGGPTLRAYAAIQRDTWSLFLGEEFSEWVNQVGGAAHDDLLISVEDAVRGIYHVRLQPRESRDNAYIQQRNRELAELAEHLVVNDRKVRVAVPTWELAAKLVGQGFYRDTVPPDDMHYVLHEFSQLHLHEAGYSLGTGERISRRSGRSMESEAYGGAPRDEVLFTSSDTERFSGDPLFDESFFQAEWDGELDDFLDILDVDETASAHTEMAGDTCEAYQYYLNEFGWPHTNEQPLSHSEFHLLEAELEMLVSLEIEFGFLMPEQEQRKKELAERLFMDPNFYLGGDSDMPDMDEPPFWDN